VPALLHGDLWGGNVLVGGDRVSGLIDPACYYGHSEVDIAMLQMFDHPGEAFFSAYGKLEAGHKERLDIYRLWPALVHLRLFGSGYRPLVERLLTELGV
jgi:fructosamine-3-kinase